MPFSTRAFFVVYETPGSVTWLQRLASWPGSGNCPGGPAGAGGGGGGGGSCGKGAPNAANCTCATLGAAMEATPAAAPPMAVTAATPVAMDFTDFTGPPSMRMDRGGISRMRPTRSHVSMVEMV